MRSSHSNVLSALCFHIFFTSLHADSGLRFMRSPEPIVVPLGDDVVFECSVNVPAERVVWRHNGITLSHSPVPARAAATSRHLVKFNDDKQEGDYQCVAWFGASALASVPAKLTMAQLQPFMYQPQSEYVVTAGNNVPIYCQPPISKPPAFIEYYHNGVPPVNYSILPSTDTLLLVNVTTNATGVYTCSATNSITGQVIKSPMKVTLKVVPPTEPAPPKFLYQPQSTYTVQAGHNVNMECSGVGTPPPSATWRRSTGSLPKQRTRLAVGALELTDVHPSDKGQYICELSNGVPPMAAHLVTLIVQVPPAVIKGPNNSVVLEDSNTELNCEVTGSPTPNITWLLNGENVDNDSHITPMGTKLVIKRIQKKHAGIYQCFATNPIDVAYESAMLQVSPKLVTDEDLPLENEGAEAEGEYQMNSSEGGMSAIPSVQPGRTHGKKEHTRKGKGGRRNKKHKNMMIPPTKPNITRLTDKSVMVRWSVPINSGLPIQFFKVQYQDLDSRGSRSWMTSNEDIPPHIRSYEVDGLVTEHNYKFRIAAVYSNNDNKLSRNSAKFFLQRGTGNNKTPLYPPQLTNTEAVSPTSIQIHWEYLNSVLAPVDGFYVYYRATTTAGDYIKATVEGENARSYVITHLLSDTAYDIKLQSFTVGAASDFSQILTHKTLRDANATAAVPEVIVSGLAGETSSHGQLYLVLGAVIAGLTILLSLAVAICICYRRSAANDENDVTEGCDKSRVEPGLTIQQLEPVSMNVYVHNGKVNGRASNGFVPRAMNITNNPLADSEQDKNVMEMSYMTSQNNNCTPEERSNLDEDLEIDSGKCRGNWRSGRVPSTGENYV